MEFEVVLEELEDNSVRLRVGYAREGEGMIKAVEVGEHFGAVVHEWPTFRPWVRITFWCEACNAKHVVERWSCEGQTRLQLWR